MRIYLTIVNLSEEFYSIIPVYGFSSEKLSPIFTSEDLREKQQVISSILHLEFASQLLLGASLNMERMNPWEYVYKCLGTKLQVMRSEEEEAQLMLQYIHNTKAEKSSYKRSSTMTVTNIFRIEREGEAERMEESGIGNRW